MQIFLIDLADSTALPLDVESAFSVEKIKYKYLALREKEKPMQTIKLTFKGKELEDEHALQDFDIKPSSAIMVEYITALQTAAPKATAFQTVKSKTTTSQTSTLPRKRIEFRVKSSSNLYNITTFSDSFGLKVYEEIFNQTGLPLKNQRLIFDGKNLEYDLTLEEQGVGEGNIIYLVLIFYLD